ncbi:MAG: hypothetical protein BWY45_02643 [Euryarchaeota archaeon ADurb.Bin294]|jgi:hypothetical protein|nr:MAG: hypothetical protein BWY45_02643 [Euryarchaeota archaeon ADurb.Bin294]
MEKFGRNQFQFKYSFSLAVSDLHYMAPVLTFLVFYKMFDSILENLTQPIDKIKNYAELFRAPVEIRGSGQGKGTKYLSNIQARG